MRIDLVSATPAPRVGAQHLPVGNARTTDAIGVDVVTKLHAALQLSKARALSARGMIVARRFSPQALETAGGLVSAASPTTT